MSNALERFTGGDAFRRELNEVLRRLKSLGTGGGGLSDGDKGDIVVSGGGTTLTIDNNSVSFAKMQDISTSRLLGRTTGGSGDVEEISVGSGLTLAAGVLSAGGSSVSATLAFGGTFTDKAQTVVTGQTWVTASSEIVAQVLTPTGVDPDEMRLLDFKPVISDLVVGTGFTVTLYSEPEAKNDYSVMCMGI